MSPISMSQPDITAAEIAAVNGVLATPYLSLGPQIEQFEAAFAAYTGAKYAAAVNSGTSGLHLAVIAAGVQAGDLVITTPFSFIASANCIVYERAIPVFVDIDPATGNIDPQQVAQAAADLGRGGAAAARWLPPALRGSNRPPGRLKALLPVHAYGQPAEMEPLVDVARQHALVVIEDACEAIGAEYKGRRAGTLGDVAVFAFYPNKQMTTGEGGMIVTDNQDWADLFRSLRNQGRDTFNAWLDHNRLGYNYRMDEMSAAIGRVQVTRLDELLAKRARVAGWYNRRLAGVELLQTPCISPATSRMSWFVYVIQLCPPLDRDRIMAELQAQGIPSRPYFSCIHQQSFYRRSFGFQAGDYPRAEAAAQRVLALPFHGHLTESQVESVCDHLLNAIERQLS